MTSFYKKLKKSILLLCQRVNISGSSSVATAQKFYIGYISGSFYKKLKKSILLLFCLACHLFNN
jgi:hypothetical protein